VENLPDARVRGVLKIRDYDGRMPVFEYTCTSCDELTEVIVLHGEEPPTVCPACGGDLKRRWSRVGVQLVGWGFARNDAMLPESKGRNEFKRVKEKAAELFD